MAYGTGPAAERRDGELGAAKRCPACDRSRPASAFGRDAAAQDGRQTYCRECRSAQKRATLPIGGWRRSREMARLKPTRADQRTGRRVVAPYAPDPALGAHLARLREQN